MPALIIGRNLDILFWLVGAEDNTWVSIQCNLYMIKDYEVMSNKWSLVSSGQVTKPTNLKPSNFTLPRNFLHPLHTINKIPCGSHNLNTLLFHIPLFKSSSSWPITWIFSPTIATTIFTHHLLVGPLFLCFPLPASHLSVRPLITRSLTKEGRLHLLCWVLFFHVVGILTRPRFYVSALIISFSLFSFSLCMLWDGDNPPFTPSLY